MISQSGWVDQLAGAGLPLPSPTAGFEENLNDRLAPGQYVGDQDLERDLEVFLGRERGAAQGFDRTSGARN